MTIGLTGNAGKIPANASHVVKGKNLSKKKLKLSTVEELIVTILDNHRDKLYGRQITQLLDNVANQYSVSFGSIYPALQRLEQKDIVISKWGEEKADDRGGARRRYYSLTEEGKEALERIKNIRKLVSKISVST